MSSIRPKGPPPAAGYGVVRETAAAGAASRRLEMPRVRHDDEPEVHHRQYRSQSGDDSEQNLITLCVACHRNVHHGG